MNRLLLFVLFISCHTQMRSQVADDDSLMRIRGKWTKMDVVLSNNLQYVPKDRLQSVQKKMDSISRFFRNAYTPLGAEARWYYTIDGAPDFQNGPSPYTFRSMYFLYYYNTAFKKVMIGDETGTWGYVFVNTFNWFLRDTKVKLDNGAPIMELPRLIGQDIDGYPVYEAYTHAPDASAVVITHNGILPWRVVSQKEYLLALRKKRENDYKKIVSDNEANEQKNKKFIEDLRNKKDIPEATKQQMISAANDAAAKGAIVSEKALASGKQLLEKDLVVIDEYIAANSTQTLEQQAVIHRSNTFFFRKKFEEPADKQAARLVVIDKDYFDKRIPSWEPQFMVVYWRWNSKPAGFYFKEQFEKNFPFKMLQKMVR